MPGYTVADHMAVGPSFGCLSPDDRRCNAFISSSSHAANARQGAVFIDFLRAHQGDEGRAPAH